jgi:hypothetical protein
MLIYSSGERLILVRLQPRQLPYKLEKHPLLTDHECVLFLTTFTPSDRLPRPQPENTNEYSGSIQNWRALRIFFSSGLHCMKLEQQ